MSIRFHTEVILLRLPEGTRDELKTVCARHRVRQSEFLRRAIQTALEAAGGRPTGLAKRSVKLEPSS